MNYQKKKLRKKNPISKCIKKNKIPGNKRNQEVKDLYSGNYKTLMKVAEDDSNKWKDILCSWTGKINFVEMFLYPKKSMDSMHSLSKYQWHFSQN